MDIQALIDQIAGFLAQFVGFFDTEAGGIMETIKELFANVVAMFNS